MARLNLALLAKVEVDPTPEPETYFVKTSAGIPVISPKGLFARIPPE